MISLLAERIQEQRSKAGKEEEIEVLLTLGNE